MRRQIRNYFLLTIFFAQSWSGFSQSLVKGRLIKQSDGMPVESAHVYCPATNGLSVTNWSGNFAVSANIHDTLKITSVGYKPMEFVISGADFIVIQLERDTIILDDLTIFPLVDNVFDQELAKNRMDDFWYHGVRRIEPSVDVTLREDYMKSPLAALAHPLSFFYYRFSKYQKERRKHYKVVNQEKIEAVAYQKFNRALVEEITGLSGDELTSFMAYCDFPTEYSIAVPEFYLKEDIKALFRLYEEGVTPKELTSK